MSASPSPPPLCGMQLVGGVVVVGGLVVGGAGLGIVVRGALAGGEVFGVEGVVLDECDDDPVVALDEPCAVVAPFCEVAPDEPAELAPVVGDELGADVDEL